MAGSLSVPPSLFMARSFSEDEWDLMDLPRQLAYELSKFDCPINGPCARVRHAALLARQTELNVRIRRASILDRWVMRKYRVKKRPARKVFVGPLTDMGMDEVIENGRIVDKS